MDTRGFQFPPSSEVRSRLPGECTGSIESLIGQIAEFGIAFNAVVSWRCWEEEGHGDVGGVAFILGPWMAKYWPSRFAPKAKLDWGRLSQEFRGGINRR